jgi:hypothetical protein
MRRALLITLGMSLIWASRLSAAGNASPTGRVDAHGAAAAQPQPADRLPVTRAETAVAIARALAGGDARVPPAPPWPSYRDVPETHWAFRYIEYAKSLGVISGYADGTFRPEAPVDRAQMAVFLARALVAPDGDAGLVGYAPPFLPTFTDVAPEHWAYAAIEYLADPARGIAQGNPDGSYHPEQRCTVAELAALVARAFPEPKSPAADQPHPEERSP